MTQDQKVFGDFLRKTIKQAGLSQSDFYSMVGITKPYFYDILSGKVKPPPPEIQYRMIRCLNITEHQEKEFLNFAANGRGEIPADIVDYLINNHAEIENIRERMRKL